LGILRSLLKRPDILVVNNMLNALDDATRTRLTDRVLEETVGATVIWVDTVSPKNVEFDQSYRITEGQLLPEEPQKKTSPISPIQTASSLESSLDREAAVLRDVPLLASLDWPGLKLLAFTSKRQDYRAGEILFEQGDTGEAAYVVLTGQADVVVEGENSSRVLYSLGQGQMVGELSMLSQMPRSATVRAKTDLRLLRLDREIFFETMRQNPAFSFEVSRDLGARLVATTEALRNE
jgi:hypothetical protein